MTTQNEIISCPKCGHKFAVADALASQMRSSMEAELHKEILLREKQFAEQKVVIEQEAEKKAGQKAQEEAALRMGEMQQALDERNKQVEEFRRQELALRQKQRELEEGKAALELDVARRLDEEREKMRNDVAIKIQEEHRRKDLEKDKVIGDLKSALDDMKRKAEQGSMETQGEVLEQDIEDQLRHVFLRDEFRAIKKGERGADLIQIVRNDLGVECGTILWEIKNAKAWGKDWLQKFKDDMMQAKAAIGILSSVAPHEGIVHFGFTNGVWVSDPVYAIPLAAALRQQLMAVAHARAADTGKTEKIDMVYNYITGNEFRQRIESIVDAFKALKNQVVSERAAMEKQWSERQKQIDRVVTNTSGLYGDFCGIIGSAVPAIPALELGDGGPKELGTGEGQD